MPPSDRRYGKVVLETDQLLVKALNGESAYSSQVGFIMQDFKELLHEMPECSIKHVKRSENKLAHPLTRAALNPSNKGEWRSMIPPPFLLILYCDHNFKK